MVADEQQITCSVGIGPTKFVAKVASRAAKPDGLVEVDPDRVTEFLHPMPVEAMWGVGRPTAEKLNRLGIMTIGDLAHTSRGAVRQTFGPHAGAGLIELAWGRDPRRVVPMMPERSVGSQQTFGHDSSDPAVIKRELLRMADRTASRMRRQRVVGRTVTLTVRFANFTDLTRSATLSTPDRRHRPRSTPRRVALYDRLDLDRARIRRVGVRVEQLVDVHRACAATPADRSRTRVGRRPIRRSTRRFGGSAKAPSGGPCWPPAAIRSQVRPIGFGRPIGHLD